MRQVLIRTVTLIAALTSLIAFGSPALARAAQANCGLTSFAPEDTFQAIDGPSASDLWAVDGGSANTAHYDGSSWTTVPAPGRGTQGDGFYGVSVLSSGKAWAVGFYYTNFASHQLIERWNGSEWRRSNAAPPTDGALLGVKAFTNKDVWAVGSGLSGGVIEHYDGTSWSYVSAPASESLVAIDGTSPQNIWAADYDGLIEHYDGTSWSVTPTPADVSLSGISAASASDAWAVGTENSGGYSPVIEHWDGVSWSIVASPDPGNDSSLSGVSAVGTHAWAVGNETATSTPFVERWTGSTWKLMALTSLSDTSLRSVVGFVPSDVWAVGDQVVSSVLYPVVLHC